MNIKESCPIELENILDIINAMKQNRIYEISKITSDGSITYCGQQLEKELINALNKIQKDVDNSVGKFDSII